jgi:hypothetical protein
MVASVAVAQQPTFPLLQDGAALGMRIADEWRDEAIAFARSFDRSIKVLFDVVDCVCCMKDSVARFLTSNTCPSLLRIRAAAIRMASWGFIDLPCFFSGNVFIAGPLIPGKSLVSGVDGSERVGMLLRGD